MNFPRGQSLRGDHFTTDETVECDVVVIGSGAGGAAAAWQLTEAGLSVAIVEEGRKFEPEELSTRQSWALRHLYAERGTSVAIGNVFLPMPRGKAVGGSTLLNSAICFRTPAHILNRWRDEFGVGWADHAAMQPTFAEVEAAVGVAKTSSMGFGRAHNLVFQQGVEALKMKGDYISRNAPGCAGCGLCQLGCPIGGKGSVDRNLIPRALGRGAALFACTRAATILVEHGAAVGVEAWGVEPLSEQRQRKLTFKAKKVFLCAGAIGTPMLLLRQGLANSSGQVGENLRVHSAQGGVARFEQVIDAWHGVPQGYYADLPDEHAVLETFSATPEIFASQYADYSKPAQTLRHLAGCGVMIADTAAGRVRPGATETRSSLSYDLNSEDQRVILKGLRTVAGIYFAAGALDVHLGLVGVGPLGSMAEVDRVLARPIPYDRMSVYASHPMGSCRMHSDRAHGVVKPTGEAWDVENLYLADASVFPTSLGVNPQITVMTVSVTIARQALQAG